MKTVLSFFSGMMIIGLALCSNARAESLEHVDQLAIEVRERANSVCWELFGTCRARPAYDQVYRDAKEVWSTAGHIRNLVLNSGNQSKIQREALEMDQLLTKIRMQINTWGNHGHAHGCTFELKQKLAALDYAVKHLMEDVGAQAQPMPGPAAQPQMIPANPAQMMPAGPSQMGMPNVAASFFPNAMPNPQMMGPSGYPQQAMNMGAPNGYNPQAMNVGVPSGYNPQAMNAGPSGYNPQASMPNFPGMSQFGR
jgi:hypothetical protein